MADLTVGVLGTLCLWFSGNVWLATAIANAIWLLGDAVGHIRQMILVNNHATNNSGMFLVAEIVTPLVILFLRSIIEIQPISSAPPTLPIRPRAAPTAAHTVGLMRRHAAQAHFQHSLPRPPR
jgi:Family of unknown function (DUF6790)